MYCVQLAKNWRCYIKCVITVAGFTLMFALFRNRLTLDIMLDMDGNTLIVASLFISEQTACTMALRDIFDVFDKSLRRVINVFFSTARPSGACECTPTISVMVPSFVLKRPPHLVSLYL